MTNWAFSLLTHIWHQLNWQQLEIKYCWYTWQHLTSLSRNVFLPKSFQEIPFYSFLDSRLSQPFVLPYKLIIQSLTIQLSSFIKSSHIIKQLGNKNCHEYVASLHLFDFLWFSFVFFQFLFHLPTCFYCFSFHLSPLYFLTFLSLFFVVFI
jgi:hypothetical protein